MDYTYELVGSFSWRVVVGKRTRGVGRESADC